MIRRRTTRLADDELKMAFSTLLQQTRQNQLLLIRMDITGSLIFPQLSPWRRLWSKKAAQN